MSIIALAEHLHNAKWSVSCVLYGKGSLHIEINVSVGVMLQNVIAAGYHFHTLDYNIMSVFLSVMGGQQKRFDVKIQDAVSLATDSYRLELGNFCAHQSLH